MKSESRSISKSRVLPKIKESEKYHPKSDTAVTPEQPKKNSINFFLKEFEIQTSKLDFYPISCSENCEGNYDKYLEITLKHISQMKKIKFEYALKDENLYINVPNIKNCSKKILLLDLDETLIHADFNCEHDQTNSKSLKYDKIINFISDNDENISVGIFIRNGVKNFLTEVSKYFDVGIFTASVKEYADAVINFLDPEKKLIKYRLYRNNCILFNEIFSVKDLRILNIDLKNVILIDNSMYSFAAQLTNGVLINSFYGNKNDNELYNLLNYLLNFVLYAKDVRDVNEQFFNFQKIANDLTLN